MCAIVGSFDKTKLKELIELNSYRGNHSYSLSEYDVKTGETRVLAQKLGKFDFNLINRLTPSRYYIAHTQAPTTGEQSTDNVHPSKFHNSLLWHNGIIKEDCIREMQTSLKTEQKWDTALLSEWVFYSRDLSEVDGTFSCIKYIYNNLYLFRNEISPMFMDKKWNISSTRFDNSVSTPPNEVLYMDFENMELKNVRNFTTKENPYYFG